MLKRLIAIVFLLPLLLGAMPVNPSYVHPDGSGSTCTSGSPCALSYANTNADDDDVVILQDGTYGIPINPSNSGSAGHLITFQAATKYGAVISNPTAIIANRNTAVYINGKSYIKIDGVKVDATTFTQAGPNSHFAMVNSASHVEVAN
jgi:hypothetical protein